MTTQQPSSYQDLQQQIAALQLETERKFNQLATDVIATTDTVGQLTRSVNQLSTTVNQLTTTVNQLAAEAASDRIEFREEVLRIWQYLSERHTGNGSGS